MGWAAWSAAPVRTPCWSGCCSARRGQFPPLPDLGSRLYLLGREPVPQRLSAARQYVAEALAGEDVTVSDVELEPAGDGRAQLTVSLTSRGEPLSVTMTV